MAPLPHPRALCEDHLRDGGDEGVAGDYWKMGMGEVVTRSPCDFPRNISYLLHGEVNFGTRKVLL